MQAIETNIEQLGQLPLPAAALIIDLRGGKDNTTKGRSEVVERLETEIADLASEMKTYSVYHWRHLTDFLSFRTIKPLSAFDDQQNGGPKPEVHIAPGEEKRGPMGPVYPPRVDSKIIFQGDSGDAVSSTMPLDSFEQEIRGLIKEINRIRTNRVSAVGDVNPAGIPGDSASDATVRVIFLTDAENMASLKSAAIYAERIKDHFRKLDKPNHQSLVSTTVICLGNSGEAGPPKKLIEGLQRKRSWEHLDTLILSEDYRDDAASIAGSVQAYVAELLLYVLLIIPPFGVNAPPPQASKDDMNEEGEPGRWVNLPLNTFIVGLAALEYSARWGRRWLSYGLAKDAAEVLTQRQFDGMLEQRRIKDNVTRWFESWRNRVQKTIPDQVPAEVSALEGILNANRVEEPSQYQFTTRRFSFNIGESTIKDLNDYKDNLAKTYITASQDATLQEAVLRSTPQIMHTLQQLEKKPLAERNIAELVALQIEAEQILSLKNFFTTATGALPRALIQLQEIGKISVDFRREHQNNPLNPAKEQQNNPLSPNASPAADTLQERHDRLVGNGNKMIDGLKKHLSSWPFFSALLHLRWPMAFLSVVLILLVNMMVVLLGFAWLNHLLIVKGIGLASYLDAQLLGMPMLELIAWGLIVTTTVVTVIFANRLFQYPALTVEAIFLVLLIASALFGSLAIYSLNSLSNQTLDTVSIGFLTLLSLAPEYSRFAFVVTIVVIVVEVAYFVWWFTYLRREREDIMKKLFKQQQEDVKDVTNFIADDVALEILRRADLISKTSHASSSDGFDDHDSLGEYYFRIDRLCKRLQEIAGKTQEQQQLAGKRLLLSQSEIQEGSSTVNGDIWLNLHIRDEKLETEVLTDGYKVLRERIVSEHESLREFARCILRIASVEEPVEIGQSFEQEQAHATGEPRRLQIFLTTLVSSTLRFSIDPLSVQSINPLLEYYKNTEEYARQYMPMLSSLIQKLKKNMSLATLQSITDKGTTATQSLSQYKSHLGMSTDAFATWAQMFWWDKIPNVNVALTQDGVLAQLIRLFDRDYSPLAIMRRLLMHTSLSGRSSDANRYGQLFLLLAPSRQSYEFRQELKDAKLPRIIAIPDAERMLVLGVQHYVAAPMFIPDQALPAPRSNTNGLSMLNSSVVADENIAVVPASSGTNGNGISHSIDPSMMNMPPAQGTAKDDVDDHKTIQQTPTIVDAIQNEHASSVKQDNAVLLTPSAMVDDTIGDEEK